MDFLPILIIYSAWAIYSGYKMINKRFAWLEQQEPLNKVCKVLAIIGAGYLIGGFYLVWFVIRIGLRITDGFRS